MILDQFKSLLIIVLGKKVSNQAIPDCSTALQLKLRKFDQDLVMKVLSVTNCRVYLRTITSTWDIDSYFPDDLIALIKKDAAEPVAVLVSEFFMGGHCDPVTEVVDELVRLELAGEFDGRLYLEAGDISSA